MLPNKENSLIKLFSVISNQKTIFPTQNREQLFKTFFLVALQLFKLAYVQVLRRQYIFDIMICISYYN